jgi:uncharacterized protein (TIGR02145 family)
VPSAGEWGGLITVRNNVNSHSGNYKENNGHSYITNRKDTDLAEFQADTKLPLVGFRHYASVSNIKNQGFHAYYWSSSPYSIYARSLYFDSYQVLASYAENRAFGYSVRCFKN